MLGGRILHRCVIDTIQVLGLLLCGNRSWVMYVAQGHGQHSLTSMSGQAYECFPVPGSSGSAMPSGIKAGWTHGELQQTLHGRH